ncbi:histidinol-phosphate aminotransferase [Microcella putealis]|uniref:Aromatic amino acid aminotransferase n=1 Tax=Microcella putealis TaxID=337005 RepID=A0A4Q7LPR2_9MICO|nr:histidinol-phosphate aminotransferase [Microcella putealis]TQM27302.1 histidinol-phosphate aminotransferase [Microcella putealis]
MRLRPEIVALPAYKQGRQADATAFKLSSNENPFPVHPAILAAIADATPNRYPDATALAVRERLAERHGVSPDEVIVGAGSVSILLQLIQAACGPGDEAIYAWRSFEAYPLLTTIAGATAVPVPLTDDFRHDLAAMAAAITERTRILLVCSPNNPTGTVVTADEFAAFMRIVPPTLLVVLDEAYAEFVRDPAAVNGDELIGRYPNLVILRTFSKAYGLAGLRAGYAVGDRAVIDAARSTQIPLSVTEVAQRAVLAALDHEAELLTQLDELVTRRDRVEQALREQGWTVPPSEGNFVWLPTGEKTAAVAERFERAGIIGRAFPGDGIRISVAEHESVPILLRVAGEVVRDL